MFSLSDELKKFERTSYSSELENVMTIDDRFLGGGVTIQDLVKENNLIITEFRRMREVFANYCQLNSKIYHKIIDHELTVAAQETRLKQLSHTINNKIDESVKVMTDLHESTVQQNDKSEKLFVETYGPVKE